MSKPNQLIDAVKTATDIHNGDYSSLRGKYFLIRDKIKKSKGRDKHVKKHKEERMTLTKLAMTVNDLAKQMNDRFDRVDTRINNLEKDISSLKQDVKDINARLDYNGLKKLPIDSK